MRANLHPPALIFASPNVSLVKDSGGHVQHIEHIREPVGLGRQLDGAPTHADIAELAQAYVESVKGAEGYDIGHYAAHIDTREMPHVPSTAANAVKAETSALHIAEVKSLGNNTVVTIAQSFAGVEVWQAGMSLSLRHMPHAGELVVTSSRSTLHGHRDIAADSHLRLACDGCGGAAFTPDKIGRSELARALGVEPDFIESIASKRLLIYRYRPEEREERSATLRVAPLANYLPPGLLPLRRVPPTVKAGRYILVTELLFTTCVPAPGRERSRGSHVARRDMNMTLNWRVFLEAESGALLYLRAFVSGCMDAIFPQPGHAEEVVARASVLCVDPLTAVGSDPFELACDEQIETALSNLAVTVALPNLKKSTGTWQFLEGDYVQINTEAMAPFDPNPRVRIGGTGTSTVSAHTPDFTQDILSNPVTFTSVNAYYHLTMAFRLMERLGFADVMKGYFHRSTPSPILVDPEGTDGAVNALVFGNSSANGVEKIVFGPMQPGNSQVGKGVGNAADVRVVLHEFCHALLFAQLRSPNFGFAHSAGDSLAAILCDPGSALRRDEMLRFQTFPWIASANQEIRKARYHGGSVDGRDNMEKWGWRGTNYYADKSGYLREQILSMTLFHLYRSIGGDSDDIERRRLAALYTVYLIIKGISLFANSGNLHTSDATALATHMIEADTGAGKLDSDLFSEIRGGGVHKVIRWAFEKHGLYSFSPVPPRAGENSPGKGEGAPPAVDVYINDLDVGGNPRRGEYTATGDFTTTEIWNRATPAPGAGPQEHEDPNAGRENYLFVRIRNRGYKSATGVSVRAHFAAVPQQGELRWNKGKSAADKWTTMAGSSSSTTGLSIKRGDAVVAGPFTWLPEAGSVGNEVCVLASVSAPGDPSNLDDGPAALVPPYSEVPIPLWWLVPFDNNIGQRNMRVEDRD